MYVLCGAPSVKCTQGNLILKINKKKHTFCCGNSIQSGQKNGEFIYKGQEKAAAWDEKPGCHPDFASINSNSNIEFIP